MNISDRALAIAGIIIGLGALYYGVRANKENKEIIGHIKDLKQRVNV